MTLQEAKQILKAYNEWRRGAEIDMINPTQVGIAIDVILNFMCQILRRRTTQRLFKMTSVMALIGETTELCDCRNLAALFK